MGLHPPSRILKFIVLEEIHRYLSLSQMTRKPLSRKEGVGGILDQGNHHLWAPHRIVPYQPDQVNRIASNISL
jgi:hypothetical protein